MLALPNDLVDKFLKEVTGPHLNTAQSFTSESRQNITATDTTFSCCRPGLDSSGLHHPVQGKTVQRPALGAAGLLRGESSSGCKDPGHGLSTAAWLELPRGRGENLPPTRLVCCMVSTQERVRQDEQGSWSECIHRSPSIYASCFCQKGRHKRAAS